MISRVTWILAILLGTGFGMGVDAQEPQSGIHDGMHGIAPEPHWQGSNNNKHVYNTKRLV